MIYVVQRLDPDGVLHLVGGTSREEAANDLIRESRGGYPAGRTYCTILADVEYPDDVEVGH